MKLKKHKHISFSFFSPTPELCTTPKSSRQGTARARMARYADSPTESQSAPTGIAPDSESSALKRAAKDKGVDKRREQEKQLSEDQDITDSSGDESEWSDSEGQKYEESDPEEDIVLPVISAPRDIPRDENPIETDDEEADPEPRREWRKTNKRNLREKMTQAMMRMPKMNPHTYQDDDPEDKVILQTMIVAPLLRQSSKWMHYGKGERQEIKDMVNSGILPTAKNKAKLSSFGRTAGLYLAEFKVLMGHVQASIIENKMADTLVNGKLRLWQFLDYKGQNYLSLPESINTYLEHIEGGNKKMFAFGGYLQFLNSIYEWLTTQKGKNQFQNRKSRGQEDFSIQEMMLASRDEIIREKTSIEQIKTYLKVS